MLCKANQGKISLIKKDFKEFLNARYGSVIAEKWQNLLDFSISLEFYSYKRGLIDIFTKRQVLH